LTGEFGEKTPLFPCDVTSDDEIKAFFDNVRSQTDRVDLMLHSLAYAPREALEGDFVSTTREAFRVAQDVSAYSLVALRREATPLMTNGGSILAMTYYGAEKVVPHYNVMGVAKASPRSQHAISRLRSGPEKNSGELYFRGSGANACRSWNQWLHLHVETLSGTRTAETKLRTRRVRCYGSFSRQRWGCRPLPVRSSTLMAGIR
jgi:hypothetical protein